MSEPTESSERPTVPAAFTLAMQAQTGPITVNAEKVTILGKNASHNSTHYHQSPDSVAPPSVNPPFGALPNNLPGRDAEKTALITALRSTTTRALHVLHGIGGGGKSALALWLARQATDTEGMDVFWVRAGRDDPLAEAMLSVALQCGAPPDSVQRAASNWREAQKLVWDQLERRANRWLLIFDNADDVTEPRLLSYEGGQFDDASGWVRSSAAGLVVVTSRQGDEEIWGDAALRHRIEPLSDAASVELLQGLAPGAGPAEDAARLAARLGGLPLALRLAGRYLKKGRGRQRTFAAYLDELEHNIAVLDRGDVLSAAADNEARARRSVQLTWELSLRLLEEWGLAPARPLLQVLSCPGAPHPLRLELVDADHLGDTPVRCGDHVFGQAYLEQVMEGLASVGLLDHIDVPAGEGRPPIPCVAMHPLVASVIADSLAHGPDPAYRDGIWTAAQAVLDATTPGETNTPQAWQAWLTLPPAHTALLQRLPATLDEPLERAVADGNRCALFLLNTGALAAAHAMTQLTLARAHDLADGGKIVLDARLTSALATEAEGNLALVEEELRGIWGDAEEIFRPRGSLPDPRASAAG